MLHIHISQCLSHKENTLYSDNCKRQESQLLDRNLHSILRRSAVCIHESHQKTVNNMLAVSNEGTEAISTQPGNYKTKPCALHCYVCAKTYHINRLSK